MDPSDRSLLDRFRPPLVRTFSDYTTTKLRADTLAGLTVALLAVPQCMAYALLAEMNPVYGLYAALIGVFVGAVFSSSELIITGPTAKISLVVGSVLVAYDALPPVQAVVLLTVMVGVIQVVLSVLNAGDLSAFMSYSVIQGFIVGGAFVIIGDQIIYLLDASGDKSPYFVIRCYEAFQTLLAEGSVPVFRLSLGTATIVFIVLLHTINEYIPAGIISIVVGGLTSYFLGFDQIGVDLVGSIPRGLPDLTVPALSLDHISGLFSGALALAILGSVQTISISKSIAGESNSTVDGNQELFSQGLANLAVGFLQGFPISASFSRSFLNAKVGARTRVSGLVCGVFIGALILLAAPYAYYLPIPVLSGLIIVVVADVFNWEEIRTLMSVTFLDRVAFSITAVGMLIFQLDTAIYVGVATSLMFYLYKSKKLDLREYFIDEDGNLKQVRVPDDRRDGRVALIDVNGEVIFSSARSIKRRVRDLVDGNEELRVIILRLKHALSFDSTSILIFKEIANELRERDKTLVLSGVTPELRRQLMNSGVAEEIGRDKILIAQSDLLDSTRTAFDRAISHVENVLEGDVSREEETPSLKYTLQEFLEEESDHSRSPIEEERKTSS